ncbi:SDR family oxidoreductase [Rhizobium laguerreae]|uniref:SDR family oxidoreductase n=1 Tax=Rhizobium laguerreae TaxID=1076926 RepID=UPI0024849719|nr:SDR family NAD(P)-dependent oxidoreductase [Rhizobium laguerreae]
MSNQQKVAIITGASQGIGAGLVRAYRERNYRVVATSRSIKQGSDDGVHAVAGDISNSETAERVVREAIQRFGRIDVNRHRNGTPYRLPKGTPASGCIGSARVGPELSI